MSEIKPTVLYGLDDRPPLGKSVMLALQHVLTMFGSTVAVPLMLGPIMGMNTAQIAVLISSVMLCSGVATLIQSTVGSRLPIIQGVSFSFLAAFFMIIAAIHPEGDDTVAAGAAMPYIAGAVMVGAVLEMIIGFSGAMGLIRRVLSPVVVGPVIMLIGLALYEAGAPIAATHWPIAIQTIVLISVFSFVISDKHPIFRMFPMLLAIAGTVATCAALSAVGIFGPDHPARPNLDAFNQADWIRTTGVIFPWGLPKFDTGFIIAVMAGYLASMIESFGDYHACKQMAGGGDPTPEEISRGIGCEGIGCALTGVFGGFSSTSYSENVGLIGLTNVGSRFVVQIGAVMLILLGLFGKFGALAAAIPTPVVGGLYCAMFGLISAVGIRQFAKADLSSDRNLFIGGFALFMGISVQHYFKNGGVEAAEVALPAAISSVVCAVGQTGMAVAAILGIAMDNLIPGTRAERGLDTETLATGET
ncbi:Uric acid transporter UacT [Rubripirellula obstinata]|uniref:Uric acid transporter UacT n=1 Tax=Rubripirellula obstinata TaxID=406547 RepID=A0A5B1CJM2_9BACT|nr:solute carrier family 23 protein [Rubripirellula obstinata]KAA1260125.1 Uric acid transporter UacT [Rubripirellula obstinata]